MLDGNYRSLLWVRGIWKPTYFVRLIPVNIFKLGDKHYNQPCRRVLHSTPLTQVFATVLTQPMLYLLMQYLVEGPAFPSAFLVPHTGPVQSPVNLQLTVRGELPPSSL